MVVVVVGVGVGVGVEVEVEVVVVVGVGVGVGVVVVVGVNRSIMRQRREQAYDHRRRIKSAHGAARVGVHRTGLSPRCQQRHGTSLAGREAAEVAAYRPYPAGQAEGEKGESMTTQEKHTCEEPISRDNGWSTYTHGVTARYHEEGKWYCGTHAPSVRKAKDDARHAAWKAKWAARTASWERVAAEHRVLDGVPDEALVSKAALYTWLQNHSGVRWTA